MKKNYTSLSLMILTLCLYTLSGRGQTKLGQDLDGTAANDRSGSAVSVSADGKTMAIGAEGNGLGVRVYTYNGAAWTRLGADIDGPNGKNEQLGYSVSLSANGRTVAIGSRSYDVIEGTTTKANAGRVQIYKYNSTNTIWEEVGSAINGEAAGDQSGYSVSLSPDGKTVAIGSPFHDVTGTTTKADAGQVRIHKYDGTSWEKVGDIKGATAGEKAGWSVSLSADGKTVAIGAPGYNGAAGADAGRVQVYQYNGTTASGGTGTTGTGRT